MKKLTILVICLMALQSNAQIKKSQVLLGGTIDYRNSKQAQQSENTYAVDEYNESSYGGGVKIGYLLSDHFAAGALFQYSKMNSEYFHMGNPVPVTSAGNMMSGGVFGRYYAPIKSSGFYFFAQLAASLGQANSSNTRTIYLAGIPTPSINRTETNMYAISAFPGIAYLITDCFSLEATFGNLGYVVSESITTSENAPSSAASSNSESAQFNLTLSSVNIGFVFYLGGK